MKTVGSSAKIEAVPSPWWTSQSMIRTRAALPSSLDHPGGDGRVIEHAEPGAVVSISMVSAPREVDGDTLHERQATRLDRGADGSPRALDQRRGPGKPQRPDLVLREQPIRDLVDVFRVVGQEEFVIRGGMRNEQVLGCDQARSLDSLAEPGVLDHREPVPLRERHREAVAGEDFQAQCLLIACGQSVGQGSPCRSISKRAGGTAGQALPYISERRVQRFFVSTA